MKEIHVAKFSGGRSSAVMCRLLLDQGKDLDHIIFTNTGLESKETYAFIKAVNEQWLDNRLVMIEGGRNNVFKQVHSVDDLSRDGTPMREMIEDNQLPSRKIRICTTRLKIRAACEFLYAKDHFRDFWLHTYVGLRADEERRVARLKERTALTEARQAKGKKPLKWSDLSYAPLAEHGLGREEVLACFELHPLKGLDFDPSDPKVRLSNCLGCFQGNPASLIATAKDHPEVAKFWTEQERAYYKRGRKITNPATLAARRKAVYKIAGSYPQSAFEASAFSICDFPWISVIRATDRVIPIQPSLIQHGGCEDGECGVDI